VPALRPLELPTGTLSATSTPLWVAVDHGMFRRHGFEAEVIGLAPAAVTQAVQSGSVPFAATTGSTVSAFASGARDLVIIAGLLNKVLFQLVAQPEIARIDDLRGRTVGSSASGSTATIALEAVLRRAGLEPDRDVAVAYLRDQPSILTGLLSGQTAAGMMSTPFNKQAQNQGYRLLFDTADSDIEILGLHIASTRGVLEREPEMARRFLMAYVEAIQFARQEPAGTVESIMRGTRNDDRALAEEAYVLYRRVWDPWPSARALQTLLDNLDVPGARDVRPDQLIDTSILRDLEASGWLGQHLSPP
jgi:ABC-type nitrate/sulfonate/bicarbonate transport system substrate-binding protein